MSQAISITAEQLQELMLNVIREQKKMNPLEQRKFDEEMAAERRRSLMVAQLGKAEEESMRAKRSGCSHMRWPASHSKAGHAAPRGSLGAEWTTGGQAYQNGNAALICIRCSTVWMFKPSAEFYTAIVQNGLMGEAPPDDKFILCEGCLALKSECHCKELFELSRTAAVA